MTRLGLILASTLLLAAPSAAAPSMNALVHPGIGIGKVRLGMTLAQVERALGKPMLLNRNLDRGFGIRYKEYGWDWTSWRVGFVGRPGHLRVVRVATSVRTQRTREGIGVGSTTKQLARHYKRRAECIERNYDRPDPGVWIVLRGPGSRMTAFWLVRQGTGYDPAKIPLVGEVMVQQAWITPVAGHCRSDWTTWRW
jgi:hypothetical protein